MQTYTVKFTCKEPELLPQMRDAEAISKAFYAFRKSLDDGREHFITAYVNKNLELIAIKNHFSGTVDETAVYPREIIRDALLMPNCTGLVLCHNHPSGKLQPSPEDLKVTQKIKDAAGLFGLRVLDHIILDDRGAHYSFSTEGIL